MKKHEKTSSSGIGFTGILTIVFIVLKLTKVISWSWWWVLSPILISIIVLCIFFILLIFCRKKPVNPHKH